MSYKPIDMQVSIPRTAEMTQMAHQQQQRPVTDQANLAQQTVKNSEQMAQRPAKAESAAKGEIRDRQSRGGGRESSKGNRRPGAAEPEQENRSEHPFKGKHIDFMG